VQRSGSIFRLGIETQKLTTAIGQLAEQLQTDDDDSHSRDLAELEAALLADEGNMAALAARADSMCQQGYDSGCRRAIASNAVMSCITAYDPARID